MAGKSEDVHGRAGAHTSREGGCCREIGTQAAMRFVPGGALDFLSVLTTSTASGTPAGIFVTNSISVDPLFVQTSARNFHLTPVQGGGGSPCVDAGADALIGADIVDIDDDTSFVELLPRDLDYGKRIQTTVADMGAYEQ